MNRITLVLLALLLSTQAQASLWDDIMGMFSDDEAAPAEEATPSDDSMVSKETMMKAAGAATSAGMGLLPTITEQLGVSEAQAKGGLGAMFQAAKAVMSKEDFATLSSAVPEMEGLLAAAPEGNEMLSSAMKFAGGGEAGSAGANLVSQFDSLGLSPDMIKKYGESTAGYLKQVSPEAADSLMALLGQLGG